MDETGIEGSERTRETEKTVRDKGSIVHVNARDKSVEVSGEIKVK